VKGRLRSLDTLLRYLSYRVCRKEVYRCKLLTVWTLRRLTKDVRRAQPSQNTLEHDSLDLLDTQELTSKIGDLKTLLDLYERILVEEYSPEHAKMKTPSDLLGGFAETQWQAPEAETQDGDRELRGEDAPVCDFCGCDIFQSYFVCRRESCGSPQFYNGKVDVCVGCYVEGRSCNCKVMEPIQQRNFEKLLDIRDKAVEALEKRGETWRENAGERWIKRIEHPRLFKAALKLNADREALKQKFLGSVSASMNFTMQ
jgi:hypothetical protein